MAETNFQAKSDVQLLIGSTSIALGTIHAQDDSWIAVQCTDYSFSVLGAELETAPHRAGTFGHVEGMGHHRSDTQMYEASVTCRGTSKAVQLAYLALMGDGASPMPLVPTSNTGVMKDATASASAVSLLFKGAGSDATKVDLAMVGCFATSVTLKQDVGSNGGETVLEATFTTAYRPEDIAAPTIDAITADSGIVSNIFGLATSTLAAQPLALNSWEITASRSLERIGYKDTTNYKPYGYAQTSPYEVTGSLVCKRDDSIEDLLANFKGDSTGIALSLIDTTGANLTISAPDVMINGSSVDSGGGYLLQTINFTAFAETESDDIVRVTIAN
tara:strand:+ start:720 stop:1712 length:993 start_codon:yes stop_codon:yes gene_type:complete